MKPLEIDKSTFVPGNEERLYSDTHMFSAAGTAKSKTARRVKKHPPRKRIAKHPTLKIPHQKPQPTIPAPQVPAKPNVGETGLAQPPAGLSGYYQYRKEKDTGKISQRSFIGGPQLTVYDPTPLVFGGTTYYKILGWINTKDNKFAEFAPTWLYLIKEGTFSEADHSLLKPFNDFYEESSDDTGSLDAEGSEDYNAAGHDKHYPGQWTFTRSLSLYYWDVNEKKFKMYANDPAHVMKGGLPFKVSSATDTPTHKFYHVFAPGFDTQNIWIPASAMAKYSKPYVASDTGEYNAEGSTPAAGNDETPLWAEILPLIGLGAGLFAAYKIGARDGGKAVIGQYVAFGACGMGILSIPKFYVQMKNADKALSQFGKK